MWFPLDFFKCWKLFTDPHLLHLWIWIRVHWLCNERTPDCAIWGQISPANTCVRGNLTSCNRVLHSSVFQKLPFGCIFFLAAFPLKQANTPLDPIQPHDLICMRTRSLCWVEWRISYQRRLLRRAAFVRIWIIVGVLQLEKGERGILMKRKYSLQKVDGIREVWGWRVFMGKGWGGDRGRFGEW